jgi:hypothetical protein
VDIFASLVSPAPRSGSVFPALPSILMTAITRALTTSAIVGSLIGSTLSAQTAPAASVTLLNYQTVVPTGWTSKTPSSSMRLAEFTAPGASGGTGAEVVVYYFGPGQGGGPEANLERWKSQFSNPTGAPVYEKVTTDSTAAAKLTIAEYRGTYARGVGTGSSADQAKPGQTLIAVVAETPRGTLFFQCFGASAEVDAQRAAYLRFVKSLK